MLKVYTVLCRAGAMDNYSYILQDEATGETAVVDPSEPAPIIKKLDELRLQPKYIFNTHHHFDHTDGNRKLKELYGAKVVANKNDAGRIPAFDIGVVDGETFALGHTKADIIDVSAHTLGHILWYFPNDKIVFTGDTLFNLSVGGLFEGDAAMMFEALSKIKQLPDDVLFYPGHEYTAHGLAAAQRFIGNTPEMKEYLHLAQERLQKGLPVAPLPLRLEKACNPYLQPRTLQEFKHLM